MGFVFSLSFSLPRSLQGGQTWIGACLLQSTSIQIPHWNLCGASRVKNTERPQTLEALRVCSCDFIIWHCLKSLNHILAIMLTPRSSWASWRWMRVRGLSPSLSLSLALSGWDKWMPGLWRRLRYALRIKQRSKSAFSKIAVTAWSVRQSTQSHRNFIVVCNSTPLRSLAVYTVKKYIICKSIFTLYYFNKARYSFRGFRLKNTRILQEYFSVIALICEISSVTPNGNQWNVSLWQGKIFTA